MTRLNKRIFAVAGCWLALVPPGYAQDTGSDPVLDCRSLPSAEERLKCYDDAVDERSTGGEAPPAPEEASAAMAKEPKADKQAPETQAEVSEAAAAAAIAEQDFGLPPAADSHPDADQIEASIVKLSQTSSGKLAIELDNGQLWRQTQSSTMRVKEGDTVVIERASLGSFKLKKEGTNRSMKVKRVR